MDRLRPRSIKCCWRRLVRRTTGMISEKAAALELALRGQALNLFHKLPVDDRKDYYKLAATVSRVAKDLQEDSRRGSGWFWNRRIKHKRCLTSYRCRKPGHVKKNCRALLQLNCIAKYSIVQEGIITTLMLAHVENFDNTNGWKVQGPGQCKESHQQEEWEMYCWKLPERSARR